ncbi:MAG: M56 family metallopeptidase [Ruminococcaceae bacterium]|nr:M56 family metallopeptidase [Oscillospiraceae bacterium]
MTDLFLNIVDMSITASITVLVVLTVRIFLKRSPKWINILLWMMVAIRLVFPFSLESSFSLMPQTDWISEGVEGDSVFLINTDTDIIPVGEQSAFGENVTVTHSPSEPKIEIQKSISTTYILSLIWLGGMILLLLHALISSLRLKITVGEAVRVRNNIFESSAVDSPFVLGLIRPHIYVPRGMNEESLSYVIAHEEAHILRKDYLWKPIGFLLLCIHWFNPLMWIAYVSLCRDIEMACDERVVKEYDEIQRADYSEALLRFSVRRTMISACPLAFGEVCVKERIKTVLNYKKPAFWVIILALLICIGTAACFLTDPVDETEGENLEDGYYLLIGAEGVESIEIYTVNSSGGVVNADGSAFRKGQKVALDPLLGIKDLRGATLVAYGADGKILYTFSVPKDASDGEVINITLSDGWLIVPSDFEDNYSVEKLLLTNISEEKLSYEELESHQKEIWAYRETAVKDTVDEGLRKWGERIAAVGVNEKMNCVDVYVYDFNGEDIRRFEGALGHLSYVLIQKDEIIEMVPDKEKKLSLEDVIALSEKGLDITWEDLAGFSCTEVGSGLYICKYEINETFYLLVGGGAPIGKPMYVFLCIEDSDVCADLTKDDIPAFIQDYSYFEQYSVSDLFAEIESSPSHSSNPKDYIDAHPDEYAKLVAMWHETLVFIFGEFLEGGQSGLHGHVMCAVMLDLLNEKEIIKFDAVTGQEYFDYWISAARSMAKQHDAEWLEKNVPAIALVLKMAGKESIPAQPITAAEINRDKAEQINAHRYVHDENEYTRYILINTNEKIYNVRFTSMDLTEAGMQIADELFTLSELSSEKPLLVGVVFYGDMTSYGLLFTDTDGNDYKYIVYESGKDGSVVVQAD